MLKKLLAAILCAALCLCALAACASGENSAPKSSAQSAPEETGEVMHTLTIRTDKEIGDVTAVFLNTANSKTSEVKMKKTAGEGSYNIFTCQADVSLYNMVHVSTGEKPSMDVAFNSFTSGWLLKNGELLPYVAGKEPVYDVQFETKLFQFDGREKKVFIWTPADYDKNAAEKYSVIYMFDGQSILTTGKENGMDNDTVCWNAGEHVKSMMAQTDYKAIIVATDNNDVYRDDELVPDLGSLNMEGAVGEVNPDNLSRKRGSAFAEFLVDTVMPYINKSYNVYTDAQHTALAGASYGGLETFYAVLAYPEKFGTGGVMSASFDIFAEKEWTAFLKDKTSMENAPLLYFYAGRYNGDNGDVSEKMYNKLIETGYPKSKLVFSKNESGEHMIEYWRSIYPEFLEAVFTQNVTALEPGVPVEYEDKSDPLEKMLEDLELDPSKIEPGYIYYDNSETKWDKVYAYWWGGMAFNSFTKKPYYFSEWPGFQMEQLENTDIYRIKAPWGNQGIIFDSGVTDREVAEGKAAFQTTDIPYTNDLIGKIYKIDMSVKPQADPGTMKTKQRYSAGSWSDYKPGN